VFRRDVRWDHRCRARVKKKDGVTEIVTPSSNLADADR
jgi:hypothetical protein